MLPEGWTFLGDGWTATPISSNDPNYDAARRCASGDYQHDILEGLQALSGSTLKGTARKYGSTYAKSRSKLMAALKTAGVVFSEQTIGNRRVLVIGEWPVKEQP